MVVTKENAEGSSKALKSRLSKYQESVLVGTILGDGCLAQHGNFHRLHIKHSAAQEDLVRFKYSAFREYITMPLHRFDQKLQGKKYPCIQFATRTNPVFSDWHGRFYKGKRKIVPADVVSLLDPISLATWLMDDGSADHWGVTIQTHGFSKPECDILIAALGESTGLAVSKRRNRGNYILYMGSDQIESLVALVGDLVLPSLQYKLKPIRFRTP